MRLHYGSTGVDFVRSNCRARLLLIFCYLSMTDGASHFLKYLKKRNSDEGRLQRELDSAISKQNKLMKKMGKTCVEANAQMQTGEATAQAPTFSALQMNMEYEDDENMPIDKKMLLDIFAVIIFYNWI